jgi:hypothetical protein
MGTCKLCLNNVANKTRSHIVPDFLLRRIVDVDGKNRRNYDLSYTVDKSGMTSYFGGSVLPEQLENYFGEVTDEDIANNHSNLVVDYLFCSDCEKRLSVIESEYSKTLAKKETKTYESGVSSEIGLLFWGSVIWRMSINGKNGVKLSSSDEDYLRVMLDAYLPKRVINELDINLFKKNNADMTYLLLRCDNSDLEEKILLFHPEFTTSYCIIIDDFIVAYSINGNYDDLSKSDSLGINELLKIATVNKMNENEIVTHFNKENYDKIISKIKIIECKEYCNWLHSLLDCLHTLLGGVGDRMPSEIKDEIVLELTSTDKKTGRKFTLDDLYQSAKKVLDKYAN